MLAEQAWLKMFELPQIAVIGGLAIGGLIAITGIITHFWFQARKLQSENMLKRTLVERGLSVADIERIVAVGREGPNET